MLQCANKYRIFINRTNASHMAYMNRLDQIFSPQLHMLGRTDRKRRDIMALFTTDGHIDPLSANAR